MADKITIQIVKGCDANGDGGTIIDDASAIIPEMEGGASVVDALAAAFIAAYGQHTVPNPDFDSEQPESEENPSTVAVATHRNISYRMRKYGEEIMAAYLKTQAASAAAAQSEAQVAALLATVSIAENQ